MPSRRDRDKSDATRTPLADLAPDIAALGDVPRAGKSEPPISGEIQPPESAATAAETDTAPANVRSRPGAQKIGDRSGVPAVPRTIGEMQTGTYKTTTIETDVLSALEAVEREPEPQPLFVNPRALVITTLMPYAILALVPSGLDVACRASGVSSNVRAITSFVALGVAGVVALVLLLRNWRVAFHAVPTELHPISVLELWERRVGGRRGDGWITGSLAIIGGFVVMLFLSVLLTSISRGVTAIYAVPYLLILLFVKGLAATLFVGYLQRGLFTLLSPTKATVVTGVLYGVALAAWNILTIAASTVSDPTIFILTYVGVGFAVAFAVAWIRLRSGSLLAAVAFQLLLLLLGIAV